jgi:hypothetical protein
LISSFSLVTESVPAFQSTAVAQVFDSYPPAIRKHALRLRELIFEVAKKTSAVDRIEETLKWGEPAYVAYASTLAHKPARVPTSTKQSRTKQTGPRFRPKERIIGSAVRIGWKANDPDRVRLLFQCQTTLIDSFHERFADEFTFEGNRAIVFEKDDVLPREALAICIAAALTYHVQALKTALAESARRRA